MIYAIALALAYVCGSFPSAYLAGRLVRGVDLRTVGSGNLGATNVYREVGAMAAVVVLLLDAAKGWVAVTQIPRLTALPANEWWTVAMGAAAIAGHAKPIFLLWRGGGKGVATASGVFLALAPVALGFATLAFAGAVAATQYVSLGSIIAAVVLPIAVAITHGPRTPVFVVSLAVSAFVIWAHRSNVQRMRAGQERKLGKPRGAAQ